MGRIIGLEVPQTKEVKQEAAAKAAPAVTAEAKKAGPKKSKGTR